MSFKWTHTKHLWLKLSLGSKLFVLYTDKESKTCSGISLSLLQSDNVSQNPFPWLSHSYDGFQLVHTWFLCSCRLITLQALCHHHWLNVHVKQAYTGCFILNRLLMFCFHSITYPLVRTCSPIHSLVNDCISCWCHESIISLLSY